MKNKSNMNIDALLDELKATNVDATFSSTEEFKKDFFDRAEKLQAEKLSAPYSHSYSWRMLKWTTSIAAMFLIVASGFFLFQKEGKQEVLVCCAPPLCEVQQEDAAVSMCTDAGTVVSHSYKLSPRKAFKRVEVPSKLAEKRVKLLSTKETLDTEEYKSVGEYPFLSATEQTLSTFGADVDTASYANARRFLTQMNQLPPKDAVRIEEFVNYFSYNYAVPKGKEKFGTTFEMMNCPWAKDHKLLLIGLQAKKTDLKKLPQSNFVFLVDDSGSMFDSMDLVIEAMTMLTQQLREGDTVSLVTYGGGVRIILDGAKASDKKMIISTLQKLKAGGYTPGGAGIVEAYKLAKKHFIMKGNNRIVLITDGDFNVGASSESDLVKMIEEKRKSEVYLSVFGVGEGNYKDNKLKMLANKGNGNYTYLDNVREAKNALVNEYSGGMFALARDVKLQVEFNPTKVYAYRLLGYELRKMVNRDFRDDTKDAGEVGVGHQVTALYELVMTDAPAKAKTKVIPNEQALKYQTVQTTTSDDILTFRLRYRDIEGDAPATEKEFVLKSPPPASDNIAWASCAAEFALLLQDSPHKGTADYKTLRKRAIKLLGDDESGDRAEFLTLISRILTGTIPKRQETSSRASEAYQMHKVQEGEDVVSIAIRFGMDPSIILELNNLTSSDVKPGQILKIPKKMYFLK